MKAGFRESIICLFFIVGFLVAALVVDAQSEPSKRLPTVTYSELLKNKESYLGKTVRLKATWTYGFEWTYLCASICGKLEKAWVEVAYDVTQSKCSIPELGKEFDNGAEVVVQGKLEEATGQKRFGHMGAYNLQFVIICVEKFKKIY